MIAPEPTSVSGKWKRRRNAELEAISGKRFCTSCRRPHPADQVKLYRGTGRTQQSMPRCDACQQRRLECMK